MIKEKGHSKTDFRPVWQQEGPPFNGLNLEQSFKDIFTDGYTVVCVGKQVPSYQSPCLIYMIFSRKASHPATLVLKSVPFAVPNNSRAPGVPEASC